MSNINFSLVNLTGLYSSLETFQNLIKDYSAILKSKDEKSFEEIRNLNSQIDYFHNCIDEIKKEIPEKWDGKSILYREFIFDQTYEKNISLIFEFRPDSMSYSKYGKIVGGFVIYDEYLKKELLTNLSSKPPINTHGNVKLEVANKNSYSKDIIAQLETEGFETIDIFGVQ